MGNMCRTLWAAICCTVVLTKTATAEAYLYPESIPCIDYVSSQQWLSEYGETVLFQGMAYQQWIQPSTDTYGVSQYLMEFATNQDTGTWSIVQVYQDGTSCLMATGTAFTPYVD